MSEEWLTKEEEIQGDFEYELFLSSDGKNTVRVKAQTKEGREAANIYAKRVFDRLIARYGTKAEQYTKANSTQTNGKVAPICGIHGSAAVWKEGESKTTGKHYAFWSCPNKNADGSYCTFKFKS